MDYKFGISSATTIRGSITRRVSNSDVIDQMRALIALATVVAGCVLRTASTYEPHVAVSYDESNRNVIRFDVYGNVPYSPALSEDERMLPPQRRVELIMRRIATSELATRRMCASGFTGPDLVSAPGNDLSHSIFFVRCN